MTKMGEVTDGFVPQPGLERDVYEVATAASLFERAAATNEGGARVLGSANYWPANSGISMVQMGRRGKPYADIGLINHGASKEQELNDSDRFAIPYDQEAGQVDYEELGARLGDLPEGDRLQVAAWASRIIISNT